jgi:dTDP-4-dehydrorhamnose 3,5-epimerase
MLPKLIQPRRFGDQRGWFCETYNRHALQLLGICDDFVQDNQSFSAARGTLRGLHCQNHPHAQAKLVRCLRGAIYDVAVDVRRNSPTFGKWVAATLTADGGEQLYVPIGFAHGFLTLTADVEIHYKCSEFYAPECETGIAWDDPDLGIAWPLDGAKPTLSEKDQALPPLKQFAGDFDYDGAPLGALEG